MTIRIRGVLRHRIEPRCGKRARSDVAWFSKFRGKPTGLAAKERGMRRRRARRKERRKQESDVSRSASSQRKEETRRRGKRKPNDENPDQRKGKRGRCVSRIPRSKFRVHHAAFIIQQTIQGIQGDVPTRNPAVSVRRIATCLVAR